MELSKETGEPIEVEDPSIVKNNHVNKKKQSKPIKPNDDKNNGSNKRRNKGNLRSDALELQVAPTSEPNDDKNNGSNKRRNKDNLRSDALELQVAPTSEPNDDKNNGSNKRRNKDNLRSDALELQVAPTSEPNDDKNNGSNKRRNKGNLRSDALELQVAPTSELTTPTLNLTTSNTRKLYSMGRKVKVDISDAIYKLPFEHGWKRELVYRRSTKHSRKNRIFDVYYYSPANKKLRSIREIQKQLDILSDKNLTIENFTFSPQPTGMNDRSKEFIRDANSKLFKEDSFVGVAVRSKKSKTPLQRPPLDYELSDDENNKSTNKMEIDFKNAKSSSKLRCKKGKRLTTPTLNLTTSNTRKLYSMGRKIKVDISDAIYKLPFEHGWKRELVYRKSIKHSHKNRIFDVYYHSPANKKLRSKREIQKQLDILSDKNLTIENFTFSPQPIAMNDRSKEFIRDANSKLFKEDSFVGVAVRSKKSKTPLQRPPLDYELSDDENNKSTNKMEIDFKNAKSSSKLRCKKGKRLTTPTLNLTTSNTRKLYSMGRKIKVDISDAIYKLPFEHGWKRELVYRKSIKHSHKNRIFDVYYHSPANKKLRSKREIQKQLDILSDKNLTIENFTFSPQPIAMNDRSKEFIRDANSKLFKEDSFVGVAVRSKKSKTPLQRPPLDYELSDDENNKSTNKMEIDFKNAKSSSKLRCKKGKRLTTPTLNLTTSNTRKLYSMGRKIKVDISDAIYKLPFEHGWKRELVYRKSIKHSHKNRIFDVYYHSPANKKLRSKREIQKQLDILSDKNLTIENFTFSPQPIAMNDRSKEFIRDANSKLFKEDSFVGVAVRSKKSKTPLQRPPLDYELSDDENNKSTNKMEIDFKNAKSSSRLRCKKGKKPNDDKNNGSNKRRNKDNLRSDALELQVAPTSEPNDDKNNGSNKRRNKDNLRSDALELQVAPTSEPNDDKNNGSNKRRNKGNLRSDALELQVAPTSEPNDDKNNGSNKRRNKDNLRSDALELQVAPTSEPNDDKNNGSNKRRNKGNLRSDALELQVAPTSEPNDDKNNGSNKRRNKGNLRSDALELQVAPTSELTTPTLNLTTSNTRKLYSMGRKVKVDISDAIYKLPFEHGWKRELVYRRSTKHSRKNRIFDVYYYSPANKKLRSIREIQKQLDILSDKNLTIENFTFSPQPIAMNDRSKEFIRDANSKLFKEDSFVGVAVRSKKSKTPLQRPPLDYKLSDDENNKSTNKMEINFKNAKSSSKLRCKKGKRLTTPTLNLTTSNTRKLYSMGRKIKVDISDAIYKLPFEHGWKRELVYRKSIKHSHKNRIFDVYYHSPAKKKLRSKREIQKQLDILSDKNLTIENFTFSPQPIAMNDRSKEFIRDANSKLFKEKITESGSM